MMAKPYLSAQAAPLIGTARVPGDKSISHRALMIGALSVGETVVEDLLEGEDVLRTASAMRLLGAQVMQLGDNRWRLFGRGVGGLAEPDDVLDMGNSGTGARLLMGLVSTHPFATVFTGDPSLRKRPMGRVAEPLSQMGMRFVTRGGGRLPATVIGTDSPIPITYRLPVASAQVKSAILLAGLNTPGKTTVLEPERSRDHSELMLRHFGAEVVVEDLPNRVRSITITGQPELTGRKVKVPADPSSAAFPAVAALIVPKSEVRLPNVGINPLRFGLFDTLREMGADIVVENRREQAGEPVADLVIRHCQLKGVDVPAERAPSMIDEYPILAVAAAFAEGTTRMFGLSELRVKESDRLSGMAQGLTDCGVKVEVEGDTLIVHGGPRPVGGATIAVELDHRIAMAFLVLGMRSELPVMIDDGASIATSFPGFVPLMNSLGGRIGAFSL